MRSPRRHNTPDQIAQFQRNNAALLDRAEQAVADPAVRRAIDTLIANAAPSVTGQPPINRVLLALQTLNDDRALTDVETFDGWRVRGRRVMRGQTALRVLPADTDPATLRAQPDGTRPTIVMLPVFDISQTTDLRDTDPVLPDAAPRVAPEAGGPARRAQSSTAPSVNSSTALHTVIADLRARGFTFERTGQLVRADGVARRVFLPPHLSDAQTTDALRRLLTVLDQDDDRNPPRARVALTAPGALVPASSQQAPASTGNAPTRQHASEFARPRDAASPRGAVTAAGDSPAVPPAAPAAANTLGELPAEFATQWPDAARLIDRSRRLTPTQTQVLGLYESERDDTAVDRAQREVIAAAVDAERDDAYRIAMATPAGLAAVAVVMRDKISSRTFDTLISAWAQLLGELDFGSTTSVPSGE